MTRISIEKFPDYLEFEEFNEKRVVQVYNRGKEKGLMDYTKKVLAQKFPKEKPVMVTRMGNKMAKFLYDEYLVSTINTKTSRL